MLEDAEMSPVTVSAVNHTEGMVRVRHEVCA